MAFPPFLYDYDSTKIQLVGGVAELILPNTSASLTILQVFYMSSLTSLTESVTKSGSDSITYQMKVAGVLKYWNGSAWATSDGSAAQSNTAAVVNANASSLISSPPQNVQVVVVFFGSGSTTPSIDNLVVAYDQSPIFNSDPNTCTVYAYIKDILGNDLDVMANAPVLIATNDVPFLNDNTVVATFTKTAAFASDNIGLIASIQLKPTDVSNQKIRFMITYQPNGETQRVKTIYLRPCVIPNQNQADLTALTSIDTQQLI